MSRKTATIALRAYLIPMASARALRIAVFILLGFLGLVGLALLLRPISEFFSSATLERLGRMVVIPGIPLMAILLSEMPLRDGIRQQTLLYSLLGPPSRFTLAWVRTLTTAVVLAVGGSVAVILISLVQGGGLTGIPRELLAIWLGAGAYIGLFGLIHLILRRGLIANLAIYLLLDESLGRVPFAIRNLSPAYHMRVLADQLMEIKLPIALAAPPTSVTVSAVVMILLAVVFTVAAAYLFTRKGLGELC